MMLLHQLAPVVSEAPSGPAWLAGNMFSETGLPTKEPEIGSLPAATGLASCTEKVSSLL